MKRGSLISRRQHEEALANLRRAHQAEVDRLTADNERLRGERDQFKKDRDTQRDEAAAARAQLAKYEHPTTVMPITDPAADRKAIDEWERQLAAREAWAPAVTDADRGRDEEARMTGGTARPTHPALILQRALDRCRALERRLADAEGRKPGSVL